MLKLSEICTTLCQPARPFASPSALQLPVVERGVGDEPALLSCTLHVLHLIAMNLIPDPVSEAQHVSVPLVCSSLFVEDGAGNVIGEVHQKWHLWRRRYDLVLNGKQFSAVNSGLLAWEFLLRDEAGGELEVGMEC